MKLKNGQRREIMRALALVTQIGLTLFVTIFIALMLGRFLDGVFNTAPWLLLTFTILGVLAAFRNLYFLTIKDLKNITNKNDITNYINKDKKK